MGSAWFDYAQPDGSAHLPAVCSNAGYCNGATGDCSCQMGYTGHACQRSTCTNDCSGHGHCVSIRERAETYDGVRYVYKSRYLEWDANMNFGCVCEKGWTGYDCSLKQCPFGDDPLTEGTKEVQSVRTSASHRDEVQSILLTADYDMDEVQVIRVQDIQPATGDFPIIGSFALVFDTTTDGGACRICASQGVGKTSDITTDAEATGSLGLSMKEKLQDITPSVIDQVIVHRVAINETNADGVQLEGFEWYITFNGDDVGGNVPQLQIVDQNFASGNSVVMSARTEREGNEVNGSVTVVLDNTISRPAGGCFTKCFDGRFNVTIPYDTRAADLDLLIESLPNIPAVSSEVRYIGGPGVLWLVTFTRNYGDVASLECDYNNTLLGTNNVSNPLCSVTTIQDGYFLNGTFALRLGSSQTSNLPWNVTREQLAIEIDDMDSTFGGINVSRAVYLSDVNLPYEWTGGYEWHVTWINLKQDLKLELVSAPNATDLNGAALESLVVGTKASPVTFGEADADATAEVNEVQIIDCVCSPPCSGSVRLSLYDHALPAIGPNSSLADLKAAIESIPEIDLVNITGYSNETGTLCDADGVTHAITFLANPGNVPPLVVSREQPFAFVSATDPGNESFVLRHGDFRNGTHGAMSRDGSRVLHECSNRGFCNRATGECACYANWGDSDRVGVHQDPGFGTHKDCSRNLAHIGDCPGSCLGRGFCRGPSFVCECPNQYSGPACELLTCPNASAWYDEARPLSDAGNLTATDLSVLTSATVSATAVTNTAMREQGIVSDHRAAICGGQGLCDGITGKCTCAAGFTGTSCARTACRGTSLAEGQGGTELYASGCSGHGSCISMRTAANSSRVNATLESLVGTVQPYTGWDLDKNYGCSCSRAAYTGKYHDSRGDFFGPDCQRATCPASADPERPGVGVDALGRRLVPYASTLPLEPLVQGLNGETSLRTNPESRNLTLQNVILGPKFSRQRIVCNASRGFVILDFKGSPSVFIFANTSTYGNSDIEAHLESMAALRDVAVHPSPTILNYTGWFRNVTTFFDPIANMTNTTIEPFNSSCSLRNPDLRDYVLANSSDDHEAATAECFPFMSLCGTTSEGEPHATDVTLVSEHGRPPVMKILSNNLEDGYMTISTIVVGTKESIECSRRGACDFNLGRCVCAPQYGSSDGLFGAGYLGDCGHLHAYHGLVTPTPPPPGRTINELGTTATLAQLRAGA